MACTCGRRAGSSSWRARSNPSLGYFRGTKASGKSLLEMTCLAAENGDTLELEAEGLDAEAALAALAELVAAGFHMDDEAS